MIILKERFETLALLATCPNVILGGHRANPPKGLRKA
jgi:hypothetical protein